ncbi:hypothetical protein JQS43_24580 [Natronosporangium hydrolyticum]|uniref:Uncharacterized protein n=1 Tax=Natronosporangium hydrolyticum TaxID=2811111 RepID=A0A895YA35_9ACTN|nr:hypothetical protein [Natronosporangium hydrolyticum]QSB14607.1 hypothetical protein JQS43_24580 [Natronosporangium hydrolyticum]
MQLPGAAGEIRRHVGHGVGNFAVMATAGLLSLWWGAAALLLLAMIPAVEVLADRIVRRSGAAPRPAGDSAGQPTGPGELTSTPQVEPGHHTSVSLDAASPLVIAYAETLDQVELAEVPMLDLIHTLMPDASTAPATAVAELHQAPQRLQAVFRGAAGNLVVRIDDQLRLLWPVQRPVAGIGQPTAVRACSGRAFVAGDNGRLVPLPAASPPTQRA